MKKLLFLMLSAAVAVSASAGVTSTKIGKNITKQSNLKAKTESVFKMDRSVEIKPVLKTPVSERPEGETKTYLRTGTCLYVADGYVNPGEQSGVVELIFANDNKVWFKNIFYGSEYFGDFYVYGDLSADGTQITVPMGQSVAFSTQYNADIVLSWGTTGVDGSSITWTEDASVTEAVYVINGNTITLQGGGSAATSSSTYPDYEMTGLGLRWSDDNSFGGFCEYGTVLTEAAIPTQPQVTVEPGDTYGNVTWNACTNADAYNLRWRPVVDTSGNYLNVTLPEDTYSEELDGWSTLDVDGDGNGWGLTQLSDNNIVFKSASYSGGALTPDNWLIAPIHKLEGTLKFKIGHKSSYPEKMEVWIGTEDAIEGNTVYLNMFDSIAAYTTETTAPELVQQSIDLSGYNGAKGYIVFRHYGTSDQWELYLDDIEIGDPNAPYVEPAAWVEVNGLTDTNYAIEGLTPETDYEVEVCAYNNDYETWSNTVYFTTLAEQNNVYIIGEVEDKNWAPNDGVQMTFEDGVYTATVNFDGRNNENGEEVNYFALTKKLAATADDWATCNANRFGSETDGDFWVTPELMGQELGLIFPYEMSYRIAKGEYKITVNMDNMTLVIEDLNPAPQGLRGDVDMNEEVAIADVSALIDYLLTGDATGISLQNADCDLSGTDAPDVTIADVSALIDYLLNGAW